MISHILTLLLIDLFGLNLSVAELVLLLSMFGTVAGFLVFYKSDKLKRKADAKIASLSAVSQEIDLLRKVKEHDAKILQDLQDIQKVHLDDLTKKQREINELLRRIESERKINEAIADKYKHEIEVYKEKNSSFRRLMAKLDLPFWETDANGDLIYVNGEWLKLFGLKLSEATGKSWHDVVSDDEVLLMEIAGDAQQVDGSDDSSPTFTINNRATGEKYKVKATYVMVKDHHNMVVEQFGVTLKIDEKTA